MAATIMPDQTTMPALALVGDTLARDPNAFLSVHDGEGRFTFCTSSVDFLLGRSPSQVQGGSLYDLVHPDDVAVLRSAHVRSVAPPAGEAVTVRLSHADGSYRRVVSRAWGTADERGEVATVVCLTSPSEAEFVSASGSDAARSEAEFVAASGSDAARSEAEFVSASGSDAARSEAEFVAASGSDAARER